MHRVLKQYFGSVINDLANLPDPRKSKHYGMDEIVMSCIALFLFKEDSRNAFNNDRKEASFIENYRHLFSMELAHMDTVKDVFCQLESEILEKVKVEMVSILLRNKVFVNYRYKGHYIIAIDGTGVVSYDYPHCDCCLTKTSKNDKTTYFHNVLEAKLITSSGFSISIGSEWINNEGKNNFDKQDCERNAFKRLAAKIKKNFPRLPIILLGDGLYPYKGFFDTCDQNKWKYVLTLQDRSLKSLQEDIQWEKRVTPKQSYLAYQQTKTHKITGNYHWLSGLEYEGYSINWVECIEKEINVNTKKEKIQKFVHITNLEIGPGIYLKISNVGRLRQKIENEGFKDQKRHGYGLQHKYIRKSFNGMKNFYQCLQIAHIINQLVVHTKEINKLLQIDKKQTVKNLWKRLLSFFLENVLSDNELPVLIQKRFQIRLC